MKRRTAALLIAAGLAGSAGIVAAPYVNGGRPRAARVPRLPALADTEARFIARADEEARAMSAAYNVRTARVPDLRVVCRTENSVSTMLAWAREHGIGFAVRSGGHCFAGLSQHTRLVIDLREMNTVTIDETGREASAGPGATIGALYEAAAGRGLAASGGVCPDVAVGGQALGGGGGYLVRSSGLLCDTLTSLALVDAEGRLQTVSAEQNSDLFWACRGGGGGSFGIATRVTVRLRAVGDINAISIHRAMTAADAAHLLARWQEWSPQQGRELATHFKLVRYDAERFLVSLTGQSTGPRDSLIQSLQALAGDLIANLDANVASGPYGEILGPTVLQVRTPLFYQYTRSDFLAAPMTAADTQELVSLMEAGPVNAVHLQFEAMGGAVDDLAAEETAFPHRGNAPFLLQYATNLSSIFQRDERLGALDAVKAHMARHATGGAYANYRDDRLDNWAQAYWGRNLPRLIETKRRHDPANVFRHKQSIPLR